MSCCSENKCFERKANIRVVSSRGQEDGAGEALAVHASSTLFCPHCHALTPQVDALAKQLTGNVLTPTRTEHMLWGLSDLCFSTIPEGAR